MKDIEIRLRAIGVVRRGDEAVEMDMEALRKSVAIIEIYPEYVGGLKEIERNEYIWILWYAHLSGDNNILEVHPKGDVSRPKIGVFASRSPLRVNNIMLSLVRLIERKDNLLKVIGLDAYDGTPVLDIKPYASNLDDPKQLKF